MKKQEQILGFSVGDKVVCIKQDVLNFKKRGSVVGFHADKLSIFVKYDDGTYGCTSYFNAKDYLKLSDILN